MTAQLFATDMPIPAGQPPDVARLLPLAADTLDDAFIQAAKLFRRGATVWRIEHQSQVFDGPDQIVAECQARGLLPDPSPGYMI